MQFHLQKMNHMVCILLFPVIIVRPDPGAMMGRPFSPPTSREWGELGGG